ncbi:PREDICTED: uncharacterized protein LOC105451137 [Wasmannia auropunctata]|uniref:uncharacterized protein LOC105451137 n=1 Tax=Wasmannia auropunctata TaxID=64793 RepID=UPI0005F0A7F6|nr:PREDICTED: uncharacterized protein LOC105451137 [Wasmannia auropunctata]
MEKTPLQIKYEDLEFFMTNLNKAWQEIRFQNEIVPDITQKIEDLEKVITSQHYFIKAIARPMQRLKNLAIKMTHSDFDIYRLLTDFKEMVDRIMHNLRTPHQFKDEDLDSLMTFLNEIWEAVYSQKKTVFKFTQKIYKLERVILKQHTIMRGVSQQMQDLNSLASQLSRSIFNTLHLLIATRQSLYTIMDSLRTSRNETPNPETVLPTNSQESDTYATMQRSRTNVPRSSDSLALSKRKHPMSHQAVIQKQKRRCLGVKIILDISKFKPKQSTASRTDDSCTNLPPAIDGPSCSNLVTLARTTIHDQRPSSSSDAIKCLQSHQSCTKEIPSKIEHSST